MAKISKERVLNRLNNILNSKLSSASLNDVIFGNLKTKKTSSLIEVEYVNSYGINTNDAIYAFKTNDNIIISPAEDTFNPILAIIPGASNDFNFDNIIEPAKIFLDNYSYSVESTQKYNSNNILYGASNGSTDLTLKEDWININNFITYKWGQGKGKYDTSYGLSTLSQYYEREAYNASLILTETKTGSPIRCYAGCVGTAFSMVLGYWGQVGVSTNKTGTEEKIKYKTILPTTPAYNSSLTNAYIKNRDGSIVKPYNWYFNVESLPTINDFDYDNLIDISNVYTISSSPASTSTVNVS